MSQAAGDRGSAAYPAYPWPAEPRPQRPPLTQRMRAGHWTAIDCAVALFAAICDAAAIGRNLAGGEAKLPFLLLFMVTVFIPVALRRRAPVTAFWALVILGVLLSELSPTVPAAIFLAAAYVLYTVTVEGRRRTGAASLALLLAVMVALSVVSPAPAQAGASDGVFVPVALATVIAWILGYSVRQRRRYVVTLQRQAASSAVAEERLRIARELHDVVAHSMSVIAVQAGYGQYVIDTSPANARDALGAIQATSRDALEEMRRMLGVLRQQDAATGPAGPGSAAAAASLATAADGEHETDSGPADAARGASQAPLSPAPGLAGLDRLVRRTCGAGVRVTLEFRGQARPAPAGVDLSAYRIIQEALTNVVRHAGTGAACLVGVCYTDSDLVIQVTDNGGGPAGPLAAGTNPAGIAAAGTGHGLIGMRERVNLCGGTFTAGPRPDGGFQGTATLPLPATVFANLTGPVVVPGLPGAGWDAPDRGSGLADARPLAGADGAGAVPAAGAISAAGLMSAAGAVSASSAMSASGAVSAVGPAAGRTPGQAAVARHGGEA
jgi:signal transduction histidine kinase